MKHVFITHSNITKIIIEGIIRDLNLKQKEVLIISFRNNFIEGFENVDLHDLRIKKKHLFEKSLSIKKIFQIPSFYKTLWEIDELLGIKKEFILYTPQVYYLFYQIIASHKKCKRINFIEEGTASYQKKESISKNSFKGKLYSKIFFQDRISSGPTFFRAEVFNKKKKPIHYIVSERAFKGAPNRKLVKIEATTKSIPDGAVVFLVDGLVESKKATKEELLFIIRCFIRDNQNEKKIFTKFHPNQEQSIKEMITNELNLYFHLEIIDPDVIMEKEFLVPREEKLHLFGCVSSLLIYGQFAGQYTCSYLNKLKPVDTKNIGMQQTRARLKNFYEEIGIKML